MPRNLALVGSLVGALVMAGAFAWSLWGGGYLAAWRAPAIAVPLLAAMLVLAAAPRRHALASRPVVAVLILAGGLMAFQAIAVTWAAWDEALIEDLNRISIYAGALVLGLLASTSRRAMGVAIGVLVVGVALAAVINLAWVADGHTGPMLGSRLRGLIGYFNGQAAYMALAVFPALYLAAGERQKWWVRGGCLAAVTLTLPVILATQSRGSVLALGAAAVVALAIAPERLRMVLAMVLAALAVVPVWSAVVDLIDAGEAEAGVPGAAGNLLQVSVMMAAVAAVVGILWSAVDVRWPVPRRGGQIAAWIVGGAAAVAVIAGAVYGIQQRSDIADGIDSRIERLSSGDAHPTTVTGSDPSNNVRFGSVTTGTAAARVEQWQVAWAVAADNPLHGVGPGNWEPEFYQRRDRRLDSYLRQPHSITMEMAAERGIPGLLAAAAMVLIVIGAGILATRSRVTSVEAQRLAAGMTVCFVYWVAHAQVDWLLQIPSATIPVAFMAGALLTAPWRADRSDAAPVWIRLVVAVPLIVLGLAAVPNFISHQELKVSRSTLGDDPAGGMAAAAAAKKWAPWDTQARREVARWQEATGDAEGARDTLIESARDLNPRHYVSYQFIAELYDRNLGLEGASGVPDGMPDTAVGWWEAAIARNPLNGELRERRDAAAEPHDRVRFTTNTAACPTDDVAADSFLDDPGAAPACPA